LKFLDVNDSFFKFDFSVSKQIATNILRDRNSISYEVSCENKSNKGQFHIYKK